MLSEYLSGLNAPQLAAVTCAGGPMLVVAGAGSGKTRVLTLRIAWLLEQGVKPYNILALTFTNKAADEMKERVGRIVGPAAAYEIWMGTFHSMFKRILRQDAGAIGLPTDFTISDRSDSEALVARIVKDRGLEKSDYEKGEVLGVISAAKNDMLTPEAYASDEALQRRDKAWGKPLMGELYAEYQQRLRTNRALDFDDLLLYTERLFALHPEVLAVWSERFQHILVDEYQDTNLCQYVVVNRLAQRWRNLFVVGDDAQSIYSFRGARIENILRFNRDYPECQTFKLEQNYRSTQNIVSAAGSLIAKNVDQIEKHVFSAGEVGTPVMLHGADTDSEEEQWLSERIGAAIKSGVAANEIAVLYRANAQGQGVERALRKAGIPCRVYGQSFFERAEIKDLCAWLRLLVNPADEMSLRRALKSPNRGIGEGTMEKVSKLAQERGVPLIAVMGDEALRGAAGLGRTGAKVKEFADVVNGLVTENQTSDPVTMTDRVVAVTGFMRTFTVGPKSEDSEERIQNVNEFVRYAREYAEQAEAQGESATMSGFLDTVSLASAAEQPELRRGRRRRSDEQAQPMVSLMTIHMSKGLEWDCVFVRGLIDSRLPSEHSASDPASLQEERRLLYVAMTRARKYLTLSWSNMAFMYGHSEWCKPSRFVEDIDTRYCQSLDAPAPRRPTSPLFTRPRATATDISSRLAALAQQREEVQLENLQESSDGLWHVGDAVEHERFGRGRVCVISGRDADTRLEIDFGPYGHKTLLTKFARLRKA